MKKISAILFLFILFLAEQSTAQNGKTSIENFSLTNTVNNGQVALSDYSNKKGIVVIFTSNFCPYSKLYEERIESMANEFSSKGIQFLLINPNNPQASEDDSVEEMAKKARERGYKFPYLADKNQKIAASFGATKTPEAFLLKPAGGSFKVVYKGAIDDNPQVPTDVKSFYLKDAVNNLLSGKSNLTNYERPTGCMIKKM